MQPLNGNNKTKYETEFESDFMMFFRDAVKIGKHADNNSNNSNGEMCEKLI